VPEHVQDPRGRRSRAWFAGLSGSILAWLPRTARAAEEIRTTTHPGTAVYTFPAVIFSALVISWGAEAAQFLMAQGAALAILAWLQTLPEYAVEFVIAKSAAKDPARVHLLIANLTGSLRLLTGLGWPMICFTAAIFARRRHRGFDGVRLEPEHTVEVICLLPGILYWFVIFFKGSLTVWDAAFLLAVYIFYLWSLRRVAPQEEERLEDADTVTRHIVQSPPLLRAFLIFFCFAGGGALLYFMATPFLESMLALSVSLGISQFVFIQWVAPFLSEFPEKVSAFNWARKVRTAPIAVMNMVSSNFNQWTVLAATLPIVYSVYSGSLRQIHFDALQRWEILLTISQSLVGMILLLNMHFSLKEAAGIFVLWLVQFIYPHTRHVVTAINFAWAAWRLVWMARNGGFPAVPLAWKLLRGKSLHAD
jgi:cation:H+ antiporter